MDPDCDEEQDNKVADVDPNATEFGASEKAFEDKMISEMDRVDGHHIDGVSFDPIERDERDIDKGGHA